MIALYKDTTKTFETLGIKVLQPVLATVRKEDNGDYYLDLRDRADNYQLYLKDRIIAVDTPWGRQGFRIASAKLNGSKVDVKAWHLFYDANNYLIADSYTVSQNANYALDHFNQATDQTSPFTTISDVTTTFSLRIVRDSLYQAVLKTAERWGGHITADNWTIGLRDEIGEDRGVNIAYGKNITGFQISEIWDDVVTKLLPVGKDGQLLDDLYVTYNPNDYKVPYSKVLTFDQKDIEEDSYLDENGDKDHAAYIAALKADLLAQATTWVQANHFPKVNYSLDAFIEGITDIGDTIRVKHPALTTPLFTNVIAIEYDAIADQIEKVEFGNFNQKLSSLIKDTTAMVEEKVDAATSGIATEFDNALAEATAQITSMFDSSYTIYDGDQILIVDKLPKETATNVMRINSQGIGFSNTGINGTFSSAWRINGTLDMQQVNVINLAADKIKGGTLRLGFYQGNSGLIEIYDQFGNRVGKLDQTGLELKNPNGDRIVLSPTGGLVAYSTASGTEQQVFSITRDVTDIAKLNARQQIQMSPIKVVPIATGVQAGWAFVKLDS